MIFMVLFFYVVYILPLVTCLFTIFYLERIPYFKQKYDMPVGVVLSLIPGSNIALTLVLWIHFLYYKMKQKGVV